MSSIHTKQIEDAYVRGLMKGLDLGVQLCKQTNDPKHAVSMINEIAENFRDEFLLRSTTECYNA